MNGELFDKFADAAEEFRGAPRGATGFDIMLHTARCVSLWQPWASFMWLGVKANETRSWPTSYRGPLVIHAAKNRTAIDDDSANDIADAAGLDIGFREDLNWPLGVYICVVDLVDCIRTESLRGKLTQCEEAMGDYSPGRWAWITTNLRWLRPQIEGRGMQGIYHAPANVQTAVRGPGLVPFEDRKGLVASIRQKEGRK